mgnify:CR=1 FL=1
MLRFYHAILRVILRGGRKPHGRARSILANAAKQQLYNMESGILENQASMRTGKTQRRKTKKPPAGGFFHV